MRKVWEGSYPKSLSWADSLPPPIALETVVDKAAERWPERTAIDFYDRMLSFREVARLVTRVAAGFQSIGVRLGVNVGLYLPNTPHYLLAFFGVLKAGGCVVNFSAPAAPREIRHQLRDCAVQIMVTSNLATFYTSVAPLIDEENVKTLVICDLDDFLDREVMDLLGMHTAVPARLSAAHIGFRDLMANEEEVIVQNRGDLCEAVAVLQYTGGTTGIPKAAMLTHANFFAALNILSRFVGAVSSELKASGDSSTPAAPATKQLSVLPMSHIAGLITGVIAPLLSGIENVLHLRFDVTQALLDIERKRITKLAGNPSIFAAFARHPAFGHTDLSSVSLWTYGSAPMPAEVASAFAERVAQSCIQGNGYGLTETTGAGTTHIFANGTSRTGTVGLPLPLTTVEIVDLETGTTVLPVGQPGEICFSGPTVMMGYWNNPEATKIAMRGGRFHTGDIGMTDENGYLTLLDRKKDVILVGGRNVYPTRVEHAIFELPSVAETAVIGVPHEYFGEVAKAFVVLKAGYPEFTLNSLQVFLSDKLSRHEFPLELEFRASLPKTSVGKVLKKDLHAEMVTRGTVNPEG